MCSSGCTGKSQDVVTHPLVATVLGVGVAVAVDGTGEAVVDVASGPTLDLPQLMIEAAIGAETSVVTIDLVKARREVFSWRAESFFILVLLMRLVRNLLWTHHFILVNPCLVESP